MFVNGKEEGGARRVKKEEKQAKIISTIITETITIVIILKQ